MQRGIKLAFKLWMLPKPWRIAPCVCSGDTCISNTMQGFCFTKTTILQSYVTIACGAWSPPLLKAHFSQLTTNRFFKKLFYLLHLPHHNSVPEILLPAICVVLTGPGEEQRKVTWETVLILLSLDSQMYFNVFFTTSSFRRYLQCDFYRQKALKTTLYCAVIRISRRIQWMLTESI